MTEPTYSVMPYRSPSSCGGLSLTLAELSALTGIGRPTLRRFASFAVIESYVDGGGTIRFPISELPRLARGVRLRRHLRIGVASLGLVLDLLERLDALETQVEPGATETRAVICRAVAAREERGTP